MLILGRARWRAPTARAVLGAARADRRELRLVRDDWNGFNVLHTRGGAGRRPRSRLRAGRGRPRRRRHPRRLRRRARSRSSICSAPTRSTPRSSARPSWSIRATTAIAAPHRADVVLPGAAYTEKDGTYVNTEGRVQPAAAPSSRRARRARTGRSCARCRSAGQDAAVRHARPGPRRASSRRTRSFAALDSRRAGAWGAFGKAGAMADAPFVSPIANFYLTDPISRASRTMAECIGLASASRWRRSRRMVADVVTFLHDALAGPGDPDPARVLAVIVPLLLAVAYLHLCRAQGAGGDAAAPGPQRRRPVRPAAAVRRRR